MIFLTEKLYVGKQRLASLHAKVHLGMHPSLLQWTHVPAASQRLLHYALAFSITSLHPFLLLSTV